jgi:hypothetical protein
VDQIEKYSEDSFGERFGELLSDSFGEIRGESSIEGI